MYIKKLGVPSDSVWKNIIWKLDTIVISWFTKAKAYLILPINTFEKQSTLTINYAIYTTNSSVLIDTHEMESKLRSRVRLSMQKQAS